MTSFNYVATRMGTTLSLIFRRLATKFSNLKTKKKIRPGRIRYVSGFDPTSADSIRGMNGAVRFLLSTSHSERCYISQYSCGSDLANLGYESTNTIFVRVFLDSGSELTNNFTNIYVKIKLQHNKYIAVRRKATRRDGAFKESLPSSE